ncbi:hypothetical protein [Micromonospora sp. RTP1Z1]|uniref:hypothetical protein n=1 Tax=Micromonospora sp. RTP1Z1 TaxID=2994043 RepID=UPI0029C9A0C0|nr:hypothetical protein [Micromonospora sp. RTP1Z1]
MNEESERWLAEAVDQLREYEAVGRRTDDLRRRIDDAERLLAEVGREHVRQRGDVERLEHRTAIRLLASLRGTRQDDLARERAEADRAGRREEDARARLRTLRRELQAAQVRRAELAEAPRIHAALLDEKEGRLRAGGDPRAARLAALAGLVLPLWVARRTAAGRCAAGGQPRGGRGGPCRRPDRS